MFASMLDPSVLLPANELVALLVAISFAAGLNVYATCRYAGGAGAFRSAASPCATSST